MENASWEEIRIRSCGESMVVLGAGGRGGAKRGLHLEIQEKTMRENEARLGSSGWLKN